MIKTAWRGNAIPTGVETAGRLNRFGRPATVALAVGMALSLATAGLAQSNATTTIVGTSHDFSTLDGPGYQVPAGDNHCEVCHGPPVLGGAPYPEWKHASSPSTDYDGADWLYAIGDTGMTAGWLTTDCMGCHEGDIAVNDYDGTPAVDLYGAGGDGVFVANPWGTDLTHHHPVDIVYDAVLADAQGALEDPTEFLNPQGGGTIAETLLYQGNTLWCKSCHEQHNDRRFDLIGGSRSDDPEPGDTSAEHKYLILDRLCFICHTHEQPHDGIQHHIPGRADPFGDARGSDMNCDLCHRINSGVPGIPDDGGSTHYAACSDCHFQGIVRVTGDFADIPGEHHGGDRDLPYFDCAVCHADPLTGLLTGNDFGTDFARSCFECHDDLWNDGNTSPDGLSVAEAEDVGGVPTVYGTAGQSLALTAVVATNTEGDPLVYEWSFGDGSVPAFPSGEATTNHTYLEGSTYQATVSVTDGVNPPIYYEFDVVIDDASGEEAADTWAVTPATSPAFDITFENYSGSLVGTRDDGTLSFGVEFVGVIFWMDLWMDPSSGNVFWGTGDMYFANVDRGDPGTMSGIIFKPDGTIESFTASGGAPPEH